MDILPLLDWEALRTLPPKWVLGYSDISTFLFAYTLLTGTATAHGTNYVDLRSNKLDPVTARWIDVLQRVREDRLRNLPPLIINRPGSGSRPVSIWTPLLAGKFSVNLMMQMPLLRSRTTLGRLYGYHHLPNRHSLRAGCIVSGPVLRR